ncbi:DUF2628 domain-containing protein [Romboutsia weinsteinii]|uniref:DUF2628 domain-containing protein n=1 Tax=Romboutsia weinsteinii TaxID=2020949 RepID=A0A371J111_9FIRM|nr:zinc-ribbon domain-containing protein [Romboutsia weinsteinii]RDY26491.1 DUF2628 domain-containing protein [Romboutsia weinsteinii]
MNEIKDYKCKICNKDIIGGETIIICECCKSVYHQKCLEDNKKTYEAGELDFVVDIDKENADSVGDTKPCPVNKEKDYIESSDLTYLYCASCGNKNSIDSKFCTMCGTKTCKEERSIKNSNNLSHEQHEYNKSNRSNFDNKDIENFINKNTEYYITKFKSIKETGQQSSWNWPAFLIPGYWALYRKMYPVGAIIIVTNLILSYKLMLGAIVGLGICIYFGMYGNSVYLKHVERQFNDIKFLDDNSRKMAIGQKGGVNLGLAIAVPIIIFVLIFLILIPIIIGGIASIFMGYGFY